MATQDKQTYGFQTEVKQLLHLVVNSLYSNKEVFLRELISNASDALDKLRFLAISDANLYEEDSDLKINVTVNEKEKQIIISDNGIGMNQEEIIENLGTIAKSGTKQFLNQLTGDEAKDSHLIGQFGVGFYSAFIIADSVTVKSRRAGEDKKNGVMWSSKGDGDFSIEAITKAERGTEVILHLKENEDEFLSDWKLKSIINKYSDHICWPIMMEKTETDEETKEETKSLETVNKATALWTLQKSEIKDEEYKELYKHISHDFEEPLVWAHNHVEGKQEYISLLYIPSRAPFDLWQHESKHGLKLYIKRVFVMDDADQFLPKYLRFVKGVIDSNDLPLNVSREILQENKLTNNIRSASVKRILSVLEKMKENDAEKYKTFWENFGQVLKEGVIEDFSNKERIAKLLLFSTTHDDNETPTISLSDYVGRMGEKQDKIYYVTASTFNAAKNSPHLEYFRKKGIEVLLLSDRVDEWLVSHLNEFDGKKLQSIAKGTLDIDEDDKETAVTKEEEENYSSMVKQIKEVLGDKVQDVTLTNRLTDSPACIIAAENDMGLEMQRILQAAGQQAPDSKPILEINPKHVLIEKLNKETDDEAFKEWAHVIFDQAVLAEGGELDNPALFISKVNKLLSQVA